MSEDKIDLQSVMAVPTGVGSAVGVSEAKWFVARMNRNNVERATSERLAKQGFETYVATQEVLRVWKNGRHRKIHHVVIPSMVFIHCTEEQRLIAAHDPNISRFLTDRASQVGPTGARKVATIPENQIRQLKFMLGQSDIPVDFVERVYRAGDKVRVIRGGLKGLEGEVLDMRPDKSELTVLLKDFGCAKLFIDTANLELIK